jgi:ketosteroid isomerase-like protein
MRNSERLIGAIADVFAGPEAVVDEGVVDRLIEAVAPLADPDFTCAMVAFDVEREFAGPEGIRAAWSDWLEAYAELRFRVEGVQDVGDNVVMTATQIGVTRHEAVTIEQPSAAVWKFRDGRIQRVEFHLDREQARRSAQRTQE